MSLFPDTIHVHLHSSDCSPDKEWRDRVIGILEHLQQQGNQIMSQIDDLKAQAIELRKDVDRVTGAVADQRQALADANAKIDELLKTDHLSAETQQTLNDTQAILVGADDKLEAAVPEVPPPSPPVEPTPPADQGDTVPV